MDDRELAGYLARILKGIDVIMNLEGYTWDEETKNYENDEDSYDTQEEIEEEQENHGQKNTTRKRNIEE